MKKISLKNAAFEAYKQIMRLPLNFLSESRRIEQQISWGNELLPDYAVQTPFGSLKFHCMNSRVLRRARGLLTDEPDTIDWINRIKPGETLWDIGANIGCYTLYAALRQINVVAFEPVAANYALLCEHIRINGLEEYATAYCLAISERTGMGRIDLSQTEVGGAVSHFDGEGVEFFHDGIKRSVLSRQGVYSVSLDTLFHDKDVEKPQHIKIDVDGIELLILKGGRKLLSDENLKSILIEVDLKDKKMGNETIAMLSGCGFNLDGRFCRRVEIVTNLLFIR